MFSTLKAAALTAVLATAGCAGTVVDPIPPSIALAGFDVNGVSATSQTGELRLDVTNPNRFALSGQNLQLDLRVEGRELGRAISTERIALPAGATTTVRLQTATNLLSAAALAPILLSGGDVAYQLDGGVSLDLLGGRTTRLSRSGRARIVRTPTGGVTLQAQ